MHKNTVLVVEDDDLALQTILTLLQRSGFNATGVRDAYAALESLQQLQGEIKVVLCDLRLSGMSGVDLLREWKKRRPSTPFIFVTGVYEIAQVVEAVKLGAEDYITKPYNSSELLKRVAECIDAARDESEISRPGGLDIPSTALGDLQLPLGVTLEELERVAIETALMHADGNRTHAATSLGISVRTLQRKLKAWAHESSRSMLASINSYE